MIVVIGWPIIMTDQLTAMNIMINLLSNDEPWLASFLLNGPTNHPCTYQLANIELKICEIVKNWSLFLTISYFETNSMASLVTLNLDILILTSHSVASK